jgi:hypothetical protein
MLKELSDWIEANSTYILGTTLQCGHRPPSAPDRCAVVQETGGGDTNFDQTDMEWVQIQIVTRAETYFDARDDARALHDLLHGAAGVEFGTGANVFRATITAVNPPQYIGQDETRRFEFSTNYRVALYNRLGN